MDSTKTTTPIVCRYIIDVVDNIVPTITMHAYYDSKHVNSGSTIKPSVANEPPKITITGQPKDLYTLVMIDPDAPSPNDPSMREWVHWIITDIPGGSNPVDAGKELLPYSPPSPAAGIHRYILILFKQKGPLGEVEAPTDRAKFNTKTFAKTLEFVCPVATVYFNAQREPKNKNKNKNKNKKG